MNIKEKRPRPGQGIEGAKNDASSKPSLPPSGTAVNSAGAQRSRLLVALRQGLLTTIEARRFLDVLHPAARVMELRRQGFNIVTAWDTNVTSEGNPHRVARYLLKGVRV